LILFRTKQFDFSKRLVPVYARRPVKRIKQNNLYHIL